MTELFGPLGGGHYHLVQDRLLLLQLGQLVLEVDVLLLLVDHAQFQGAVQRLDKRPSGVHDLVVVILDLGLHALQLLPEELDQLVVLLQILVGLADQILSQAASTSTMPVWPTALVVLELGDYFIVDSMYDIASLFCYKSQKVIYLLFAIISNNIIVGIF